MTTPRPSEPPRRLRDLSRAERWLLLEATVGLPLIALALRISSFQAILTILGWSLPRSLPNDDEARARCAADLVDVAARHGLWAGNCLSRSVTLWWLLRRRGIANSLRIGVRLEGPVLLAHAWVEHGGRPLNDSAMGRTRYAAFEGNILPSAARWS